MYTKILKKIIKVIESSRNGHCDDGGGTGHCS